MTAATIDLPPLRAEFGAGPDGEILLEQDFNTGNGVDRISLHPSQLRLLAERAGILPPTTDADTRRLIARLCRQMLILRYRITQLDEWLFAAQQKGHEDLTDEVTFSGATVEMADEFARELPELSGGNDTETGTVAAGNPPKNGTVTPSNLPKSGVVEAGNPPKSGGIGAATEGGSCPSRSHQGQQLHDHARRQPAQLQLEGSAT